ncbi:hypothetical protein KUTeg_009073 [Tegillarca granosa]|uniref:Uncharacterized protein n=1 Tax=Tegillarca granosa TaxID=220873 RepID=A0ABQ9F7L6_TEGGR|nr:hypothetical protein KUTeg_009073 [Tegillarca granosa]
MITAIDCMVKNRSIVGIPSTNQYLFAAPSSVNGYLKGWDALHAMGQKAKLARPELLTTTNLRKYIATVSQIVDLGSNQELEWLANHMGHSLSVHRQYYRLQEHTLELAKVSKLLIAEDAGKCHHHTMDIHMVHYKQTSDVIKRVEVAKLLLIQDLELLKETQLDVGREATDQSKKDREFAADSEVGWEHEDSVPLVSPFLATSGLSVELPDDPQPIDFFKLLFKDDMWTLLIEQTNLYADTRAKICQITKITLDSQSTESDN